MGLRWLLGRRVDFGVLQTADGRRPEFVRGNEDVQSAVDKRLQEFQREFVERNRAKEVPSRQRSSRKRKYSGRRSQRLAV